MRYAVQPGDTLYRIAEEYETTVQELLRVNPQVTDPNRLITGQVLNIPPLMPAPPPGQYRDYIVRRGENFRQIAAKLGVKFEALRRANPDIPNINFLLPGQVLRVPLTDQAEGNANAGANQNGARRSTQELGRFGVLPIVAVNRPYGYRTMQRDLLALLARFPFLEQRVIGRSVLGREIPAIRLGRGPKHLLLHGSTHAREWITTLLLMKFIEDYARAYQAGTELDGFDIRRLFDRVTIWVVPMVNPDGVDLVVNGLQRDNPYYEELLAANQGMTDFAAWKANVRGVDINRNFPADWEKAKEIGAPQPGPQYYAGPYPASEPETRALMDFTRQQNFDLALPYHAQGEVIYWGYGDIAEDETRALAERLAAVSGYQAIKMDRPGGYKEWFMQTTGRPGLAPEIGRGAFPIPLAQFPEIYRANLPLILTAATS